ncbi:MAG TPA: hypothetical protein VFL14_07250 [Xanthomonadales bacterium]|nr:hypothetical protein [Xanthomonadales bacterium]
MRILAISLSFAMVLAAGSASAKDPEPPLQRRLDPTQFDQLAALVRAELAPGGRYGLLEPAERSSVEADLAHMERLLEGHARVDELSTDEQVDLLNTQERVNALLTKRDRDRLICEYQRTLGTHRRQIACQTYGEYVARRETSQEEQRKLMQREQLCREITTPGSATNSGNGGVQCF